MHYVCVLYCECCCASVFLTTCAFMSACFGFYYFPCQQVKTEGFRVSCTDVFASVSCVPPPPTRSCRLNRIGFPLLSAFMHVLPFVFPLPSPSPSANSHGVSTSGVLLWATAVPKLKSRRPHSTGFPLVSAFFRRGYATAVVGVSFASVCSHWLISIEHPTSTMEAVHLLLHACTEAISVLLWVSVR